MTDQNGPGRSGATEVLRRMLDERGEYYATSGSKTWWGRPIDVRTGEPINVYHYQAQPMGEDRLYVELQLATPEQAIAATLGSCNCTNGERTNGTCHMRLAYEEEDADGFIWPDHYECSVCGANVNGIMPSCDTEVPPRFCPNCGRKVVNA